MNLNGHSYGPVSNEIAVEPCLTLCDLPLSHFRGLIGVNVAGASGAVPSARFYANVAFE